MCIYWVFVASQTFSSGGDEGLLIAVTSLIEERGSRA